MSSAHVHMMNLAPRWFEEIDSGRKTFEARVNDEKRKRVQEQHTIVFSCGDNVTSTSVVGKQGFGSFVEAIDWFIEKDKLQQLLPDVTDRDEAIRIYHEIPGYAEAKDVVVFEIMKK